MRDIGHLQDLVAALPGEAAAAAARIFRIDTVVGTLDPPAEMGPWIERHFGSVDAVRRQRVIRVTNLVTLEGALFNELRSRRPLDVPSDEDVRGAIERSRGDPFCDVERGTPADSFGRVRGRYGTTASNIAKADGFHAVLVFKDHDPLAPVDAAMLADLLSTGREWARHGLAQDSAARYYLLIWNCLWRAGGSIVHGHMQLALTRGMAYPKIEALRRQAEAYKARHGRSYLDDLWLVHEALGLGVQVGAARVMASLAPVKEREVLIIGEPGSDESALAEGMAHAVRTLRAQGMRSHNLALYLPPLAADGEDWSELRPLARLVDRGDASDRTSDIGALELYAVSVISSDPFAVGRALAT